MGQHGGQRVDTDRYLPADQVVDRRTTAPVRGVNDVDLGDLLQELTREMVRGADAGGGKVQRAGLGFRAGDQLWQRAGFD
jgi:hypothetical protein